MPILSPLQLLPEHVIRLIVCHVVASSRLIFDNVLDDHDRRSKLLRPLLWTCRNIRASAYSLYCSHFALELTGAPFDINTMRYLQPGRLDIGCPSHNHFGYATHQLARVLIIELDERTVYTGKALAMLSHAPYDGIAFPLARTVTIFFVPDVLGEFKVTNQMGAETNIRAFVERVKQMTPRVNDIEVAAKDPLNSAKVSNRYFSSLITQLFQLVSSVKYGCLNETVVRLELQLSKIRDLVNINCIVVSGSEQFVELARRNSQTLQSLDMKVNYAFDCSSLFRNPGSQYLSYPRLVSLKLWMSSSVWFPVSERPIFAGAVPFPNLRLLKLKFRCPLADDTLFRGNAGSLEYLELGLDESTITMLRKHKVFTASSHPRLKFVNIINLEYQASPLGNTTEFLRFVLSIGPEAPARLFVGVASNEKIVPALVAFGDYPCIQVLSLPGTALFLWDIFTLVKRLPCLTDLHVSPLGIGPMPKGVVLFTLPAYVRATYYSMGERFRCWDLYNDAMISAAEGVTCVLLMALACPNFDYAVIPHEQRENMHALMEHAISQNAFKQYSTRLRRLLFKE